MHFIGFFGNAPTTSRQGTLPFYKNYGPYNYVMVPTSGWPRIWLVTLKSLYVINKAGYDLHFIICAVTSYCHCVVK
jgi:hypothetical protein